MQTDLDKESMHGLSVFSYSVEVMMASSQSLNTKIGISMSNNIIPIRKKIIRPFMLPSTRPISNIKHYSAVSQVYVRESFTV